MNPRNRSSRSASRNSSFLSNGWLFADLLLALAMVFLVANTLATKTPKVTAATPTPTVKPTPTIIPTVTPFPRLDTNPISFPLTVDYVGLLNNAPSALSNVQSQVKAQNLTRRAGIVLVYAGAPDQSGTGTAQLVGNAVIQALQSLGAQKYPVLIGTSYHAPLFTLGQDYSRVTIEVYLYQSQ